MKKQLIPFLTVLTLPLLLSACGDSSNDDQAGNDNAAPATVTPAPAAAKLEPSVAAEVTEAKTESGLATDAKQWTEQTKKLGASAWESTKEAASNAAENSGELLDKTKKAVGDSYEAAKEKTGDVYDSVKDQGSELLESAKDKGSELYESAKEKGAEMLKKEQSEAPEMPAKPTEI